MQYAPPTLNRRLDTGLLKGGHNGHPKAGETPVADVVAAGEASGERHDVSNA